MSQKSLRKTRQSIKDYGPYTRTIFLHQFLHLSVKRINVMKLYTEGTDQQSQSIKKNISKMAKNIQTYSNIFSFWQKYQLYQISTLPKFTLYILLLSDNSLSYKSTYILYLLFHKTHLLHFSTWSAYSWPLCPLGHKGRWGNSFCIFSCQLIFFAVWFGLVEVVLL